MPKHDWDLIGYDDLGSPDGSCDYCGTDIRYVFMIHHPKWQAMEVGTFCCDDLTATNDASGHMRKLRLQNERRKRFVVSSRWVSRPDGRSQLYYCGMHLVVASDGPDFRIAVNDVRGNLKFPSIVAAKAMIFDRLEDGKIVSFVQKRKARPTLLGGSRPAP